MKVVIKKLVDKADDSLIEELISKCEGAMVSPFKKAKPEPEQEVIEESDNESEPKEDMDPEELEKLLELYKSIKD